MADLVATKKFWAVETRETGKGTKRKPPPRICDSVHSLPGSAHARKRWIEAHSPIGWYAEVTVTPYTGDKLKVILGLD